MAELQHKLGKNSDRRLGIEFARLFGCVGICWFHLGVSYREVAYASLPMFMLITLLVSKPPRSNIEVWVGIQRRARRLLVPWVKFSALYALVAIYFANKNGLNWFDWWKPEMLLVGTSVHLWFLPAAFLAAVLLLLTQQALRTRSVYVIMLGLFIASVIAVFMFHVHPNVAPSPQWRFISVSVLSGILISILFNAGFTKTVIFTLIGLGCFALLGSLVWGNTGWTAYGIGFMFTGIALSFDRPVPAWLSLAPAVSFLTYLLHPFVSLFVVKFSKVAIPSDVVAIQTIILCLLLSSGLSFSLRIQKYLL